MKAGLQEYLSASLKLKLPCPERSEQLILTPSIFSEPVHIKSFSVSGSTRFSSKAIEEVINLKVEPGS